MTAQLIDGIALSKHLRAEVAARAAVLAERATPPGLAVVLVGEDPASAVYVRNKVRACAEAGVRSVFEEYDADLTEASLLARIDALNADPAIHGILVQLPLPKQVRADKVLESVAPAKDVDGFHESNLGALLAGRPRMVPCTPAGVMRLLDHAGVTIAGAHAVVIGRSNIVGKPLSLLLLQRDATVTICHSKTPNLAEVCRMADILVAAVGRPGLVTRDFVKPGAAVVDVGINRVTDASVASRLYPAGHKRLALFQSKGSILVGDVHPEVEHVAGALTPVPGGVGPLTITMLMANTLKAARERVAG